MNNNVYLAAGLANGNINIYDSNTGSLISNLTGHSGLVLDLILISDENLLASSCVDKTIRIWNLTTNTNKFILSGHTAQVNGLKLVSCDVLASASLDKSLKLWNIKNGTLIRNHTGHSQTIGWSVDLLNDFNILLSGSYDQSIKKWDINTGVCLNTINVGLSIKSLAVLNITISSKKNFPINNRYLYHKKCAKSFNFQMIDTLTIKQLKLFKKGAFFYVAPFLRRPFIVTV